MNLVCYQFSREKIERRDFSHFLSLYSPERLGSGRPLKARMGSLELVVEGYDNDPREVYEIAEVRRFFAALHRAWPYGLFFCFLGADDVRGAGLSTLAFSCLSNLTILRDDRTGLAGVSYGLELVRWVAGGFEPMNRLWLRAGLSNAANVRRTQAVFEYFNLPQ